MDKKTFTFRPHLPAKEANELLDGLIAACYLELGPEKTKALFEQAKTLQPSIQGTAKPKGK